MYLSILIILVIGIIIFKLTGGARTPVESVDNTDPHEIGSGVLDLAKQSLPDTPVFRENSACLGTVLRDLLTRMGMPEEQALTILWNSGFTASGAVASKGCSSAGLSVQRGREETGFALERALLVGIQVARADDDYAGVADDLDLAALEQKAEEAEEFLFGGVDREQYVLCQKTALALQDMLHDEGDAVRSEIIKSLLRIFDEKIVSYQKHLSSAMSDVSHQDILLWGDSRDRRTYYFKMGVTNSLRRSGRLVSLGHLYRHKVVNYDVLEAYELAAQECTQLIAADNMGIEKLLQMGPVEIEGLVQQRLREGGQ